MNIKETKLAIIHSGHKAVLELIKVAEEAILNNGDDDLSADKLKNAAATKKLAIFDAFEILSRIQDETRMLEEEEKDPTIKTFKGFAEGRSK
jgi:hypothetical protein